MPRKIDPKPEKRVAKNGSTSWRVRFRHRGRQTSETFPTQRQAQDFADDLRKHGVEAAMRLYEDRLRHRDALTLTETFEGFIDWKRHRVRSDRTIRDYRSAWERWVEPDLGGLPIVAVTGADVQRWVDAMHEGGSAAKSIGDRHALLHAVYKWAAAPTQRHVEDDPCAATELPKARRKMPKGLHPTEWQALHAALWKIDRDAADVAEFMVASGWRWSEATALSVGQVEDYGGTVRVNAGWVIRENAAYVRERVEDVKGEGSLRRTTLDPDAGRIVRGRCIGKGPGDLVFTTQRGRQWHYSNFRRGAWDKAVKRAGLEHRKPTPHWLRHTAVAWAAMAGANLKEIQARIGHKSITTTMDVYGAMIDDVSSDVVERMAAIRSTPVVRGEVEG